MSLSVGVRFADVKQRQQPTPARQEVRTVTTPTNAFQIDRRARADWIDEVLADSFPASDPPSWTPGIARLSPSLDSPGGAHNSTDMLHPGDLVPHFEVTDLYGKRVDYSSIWQRKNLVLVMLPDTDPSSRSYAEQLKARGRDSKEDHTEWVVTSDRIAGMSNPGAIVADRWGELMHVARAPDVAHLPVLDELVEWVDYVQHRCPECEGEAR